MNDLAETTAVDAELAAAFDASPNPYMLLTPDLRYAGMNAAYLETVGRTRDELLGRRLFDVFDAGATEQGRENQRQLRESLERALTTGLPDHLALIHYAIPKVDSVGEQVLEDRYWSATHTPVRGRDGQVAYVLQHTTDITELHTLRTAVSGRAVESASALDAIVSGEILHRAESVQADNRRLQSERNRLADIFMQAPGFIAVLSGPEQTVRMHNAAYGALIGRPDISGRTVREALPELEGQGFHELLDAVFTTGEPYQGRAAPVTLTPPGQSAPQSRFLDFLYQPIRNDADEVVGIFVQGHDVTDTVSATDRQKLMIDELNHRVKNTLATVQSIAMQTARSHADPRTFAEAFQARLMSLSHTHNLLTQSHWEGAQLHDILRHETEAHGAQRVTVNGPVVALEPPAALALGMILHELATNAAKYGALSSGEGRVLVDWSVDDAAAPVVRLTWREIGGPPVAAPTHRGFGSRLIERSARHDLAGESKLDYARNGFVADFTFPLIRGKIA